MPLAGYNHGGHDAWNGQYLLRSKTLAARFARARHALWQYPI